MTVQDSQQAPSYTVPEMDQIADYKVSRRVGYALTLKTAPAFSFGIKKDHIPSDPGPGPGQYGASFEWQKRGIGFGSSTRYSNPGELTPSPLEYKPDMTRVRKSSSSFTFGVKPTPEHLKSKTPGPGQYEPGPSKDTTRPHQPPISIGLKCGDTREDTHKPGPNEYNPAYEAKERPGISLKFRHERSLAGSGHDVPGPGQYQPDNAHRPPPGKTFGVSRNSSYLDNGVPGPIYSPDVSAVRASRTSWSIGKSPRDARLNNGVPGPGTYLHGPVIDRHVGHGVNSHERSAPAYTMPVKVYPPAPDPTPGPNDYAPKDTLRKSAPAFTMHGSSQKDSRRNYPGPGHYTAEDAFKALRPAPPSITIATRSPGPSMSDRKPGPGAYNPDFEAKERPGVSIKFRHAPMFDNHGTPAPHDYSDKDFVTIYGVKGMRKGFTFGVKPKPLSREVAPGPHYEIGVSTLGVAASQQVFKSKLSQSVVL